jgi:hypothetical protein
MKLKQYSKLQSLDAVDSVFQENQSKWSANVGMANVIGEFRTRIEEIRTTAIVQAETAKGLAKAKKASGRRISFFTLITSAALYGYASETGDDELKEKSKVTKTQISRLKANARLHTAQALYDLAKDLDLEDHGLSVMQLQEFESALLEYGALVIAPRSGVVRQSTATQILKQLIAGANDMLKNQLDNLMLQYIDTDKVFYTQYVNARKVVDIGSRKKRVVKESPIQG